MTHPPPERATDRPTNRPTGRPAGWSDGRSSESQTNPQRNRLIRISAADVSITRIYIVYIFVNQNCEARLLRLVVSRKHTYVHMNQWIAVPAWISGALVLSPRRSSEKEGEERLDWSVQALLFRTRCWWNSSLQSASRTINAESTLDGWRSTLDTLADQIPLTCSKRRRNCETQTESDGRQLWA